MFGDEELWLRFVVFVCCEIESPLPFQWLGVLPYPALLLLGGHHDVQDIWHAHRQKC